MEIKKPATFKEQVEKLKSKVIIESEIQCENFLNNVNYYRYSAYLLPFRLNDKSYIKDTSFERIYQIYEFDRKMRTLLFSVIEEIELNLRTQFSYYHSHKHGCLAYRDPSFFNDNLLFENYERKIKDVINNNKTTLVVKHHEKYYNCNFPFWVIIEYFDFGMLSYFYNYLKLNDKKEIALIYNANPKLLHSWLACTRVLRNKCAHYSRLYYWKFTSIPAIPNKIEYKCNQLLFDQILMLKFLYTDINKWNKTFLPSLIALIDEYSKYIELKHIGFPSDWKTILS